MNYEVNNYNNGSVGCATLLGLLFIGLKLTDNIGWSWWWVLSPFWIPILIAIVLGILLGILTATK